VKPCPYRKEHEWDDATGLCRHCYAPRPEQPKPPSAPAELEGLLAGCCEHNYNIHTPTIDLGDTKFRLCSLCCRYIMQ